MLQCFCNIYTFARFAINVQAVENELYGVFLYAVLSFPSVPMRLHNCRIIKIKEANFTIDFFPPVLFVLSRTKL